LPPAGATVAFVGNRSAQPAFHTFVQLGIDVDISIQSNGDFKPLGERTDADGFPQNWFLRRISTPAELPIFMEADSDLTRSSMFLGFHSRLLNSDHRFRITTLVQTPGYRASEYWTILQEREHLQLLEPGHPRAR
jgi:hypothetical protein